MKNKKIKVVHIQDEYNLSLNIGSNDGVKIGDKFLIYTLSDQEIIDPDTEESLGHLELVKGTGKVIHLQPKLCSIQSDTFKTPFETKVVRKPVNPFVALGETKIEEITKSEPQRQPFDSVKINDLAKPI